MKTSSHWITVSSVVGAALLCLMPHATGFAQSYTIRPTCNPNGPVQSQHGDVWLQRHELAAMAGAASAGGARLQDDWSASSFQPRRRFLEQPLPHAEGLPAKPPLSGGDIWPTGSCRLPGLDSRYNGNSRFSSQRRHALGPAVQARPAGPESQSRIPGLLAFPGSTSSPQPDTKPKTEGSGVDPPAAAQGPASARRNCAANPDEPRRTPAPLEPAEPPKTPDKDLPAPKSPAPPPDLVPSPAGKAGRAVAGQADQGQFAFATQTGCRRGKIDDHPG